MKDVIIDRKSWHFWLADKGGFDPDYRSNDIFTYLRYIGKAVISGAFLGLLGLLATGLVAWSLGDFLGWLACILLFGWTAPVGIAGLVIIITGLFCGMAGFYWGGKGAAKAIDSAPFAHAAWNSLHNKICVRLKFD